MSDNMKKRTVLEPPRFYVPFLLLQFAATVFFIWMAVEFLPKWEVGLCVVVGAFLLSLTSVMILNYRAGFLRVLGKVVSIVLIITLAGGGLFIRHGAETLEKVTQQDKKFARVSVVVMADSQAQTLKDLKEATLGYNKDYDGDLAKDIRRVLKNRMEAEPNLDPYSQYKYLADGLYGGQAGAIVFNEAYRGLLEQGYENFSTDTRVIKTFKIEIKERLAKTAVDDVTKDCFVTYISGIDTRGKITGTRSDANMIVVVNPTTKQVLLFGIPRDYFIPMHSSGKKDKLTHAGLLGIQESVDTLQDFLGITINYNARINFNGMIDLIDAVGGIDVKSPVAFTTVSDKYRIKKGVNHMNGKKALYFMRSRKMLANGDNDRVSNQIRVIKALMKTLLSSKLITNFNDIMNVVEDNLQTNMTSEEIKALIKFQAGSNPEWDIVNFQLTGENAVSYETEKQYGKKTYVMEPDMDSVQEGLALIEQMKKNEIITIKDDHEGGN